MKPKQLVTKQSLKDLINNDPQGSAYVIGRALVALFNRQTSMEKSSNTTKFKNGIGFSAEHGRIGALGAKYFLKHSTLQEWQLKPWIKEVNGFPRICKYWKQLNEIANEKMGKRLQHSPTNTNKQEFSNSIGIRRKRNPISMGEKKYSFYDQSSCQP